MAKINGSHVQDTVWTVTNKKQWPPRNRDNWRALSLPKVVLPWDFLVFLHKDKMPSQRQVDSLHYRGGREQRCCTRFTGQGIWKDRRATTETWGGSPSLQQARSAVCTAWNQEKSNLGRLQDHTQGMYRARNSGFPPNHAGSKHDALLTFGYRTPKGLASVKENN